MRPDLPREGRRFLAALQFLTRVPVAPASYDPDWLPRAARYFPLVGIVVGLAQAGTLLLAAKLWPGPVPAILSVAAALLLTGALHEDGLADTADGFGGRTPEARRAIMKDSATGVYGVLALGACLTLQVAAIASFEPWQGAAALVAAQAAGRLGAVIVMAMQPYIGDGARVSHEAGPPRGPDIALACLFGLAPLLALGPAQALAGLVVGSALVGLIVYRACRGIGGHTGDVLGAAIVLGATGFLLGLAARLG